MWLIDISNSRALRLVEFLGDPPDEYAILSHTWGDHEITFEEFKAMTTSSNRSLNYGVSRADTDIQSSPGYVKILKAAMLARSQSYTYLWVDTCCINKASSAELSESINSMYLWYRKASVCYAYLSDVGPDEARSIEEEGSQFRNSRWFTRGWTLQELIAPRVVEFYVSDWSPIHTKEAGNESFCRVLSDITGIYTDVLAGTMLLSDVSVADKMRWASKRQTKRAEDTAYCLLGVFDVNMPLLYGEGPRAFVRLQEEILRQTGDQSLFLWALSSISSQGFSGAQALHGLLADSPDAFSGLGIHHIRPLQPLGSEDGEPASVTSKGLRTNMLLFPIDSCDYFAVLDCTAFRSQSPLLREDACIFLRRLWGNQFARIDRSVASGVQFFPDGVAELKGKGAITTVYVKQKPSYALPEVTINSCMFRGGHDANSSSSSFSVMEAYPPERFSMTTSVVQIREPQSGQTIVTLRFGHKYKKHWYPLVDVSVGLQSQNSEWILFYKMRPFNGSKLQIVYQDIQGFNLFSKTDFHNKDQFFGHALAHTTTHQHRGRRFLQLDVFMPKFNYPALISVEQELQLNNTHPFLEDNVLRQIQDVTRQCCYQDKLEYIFSFDQSPSLDGVRTNIEGFSQLSKWFDAFSIDESGPYASMIHSVRNGNFSLIKTLVAQDQSLVECQTSELDDFRPVHWAAAKPYPGLMKTLANCKADLTSRTRSGWLAIHVAILAQAFPTVEYLWDKTKRSHDQGSLVTSTGETLSHLLAAYAGETGIDQQQRSPDVSQSLNYVQSKIKPEYVTNHRGELPVHRAAANGNSVAFPVGRMLPASLVNEVDYAGRSVLFHAACGGNEKNIVKLFQMGASLATADHLGRGPMHAAVMANQPPNLGQLLRLGADPNTVSTSFDLTPLHFACVYGFPRCVIQLLGSENPETAHTRKWATGGLHFQPIHLAVGNEHIECTKALLSANCDINSRCYNYLRLKRPRKGPLEETEVVELPTPMVPFELAVFVGNNILASMIFAHSDLA